DASKPLASNEVELVEAIREKSAAKIAILNKSDLGITSDKEYLGSIFDKIITTSLKYGDTGAVYELSEAVRVLFTDEKIKVGEEAVVSSARHNAALKKALSLIEAAIDAYSRGVYTDAAASEVEGALSAIAEIDGRAVAEEVVRDVFSKFCVGK
ncbi:MAG: hypothetical protein IKY62_02425, partial [Clostridia bacterium]|nr:hypothetical protein [Clostridia bacterium]